MEALLSEKKIRWENGQWVCDPLTIRVRRADDGTAMDIDPQDVSLSDDRGWLAIGQPTVALDKSLVVPVSVKQDAVLGPQGQGSGAPEYAVGTVARPAPARERIEVLATVTVELKPTGIVEATAAASMFPAAGGVLSQTVPPITLRQDVSYGVVPPPVSWSHKQENPVRLNGLGNPDPVELSSAELPPGWLQAVRASFAISEKSKNLGLSIGVEPLEAPPNCLAARLQVVSSKLVLHPVGEIQHDEGVVNASIDVFAITQSPHLGTQVQPLTLDAEALDVCVYFKDRPATEFEWNENTRVGVVPPGLTGRRPGRCKLPVSVRHLKEWPCPTVRWEMADRSEMGDGFAEPAQARTQYLAPDKVRWEEEGRPGRRTILCRVGDGEGERSVIVPRHVDEDLYHYFAPFLSIEIGERLVVARLRVRVRPADLAGPDDLDLGDQSAWESLEREIILNVKL